MAAREGPHRHHLRQRRSFLERKDVLNELDDRELVKRYWQDPAGIIFVTNLVRERLKRPTARNKASLSPRDLVALHPPSYIDEMVEVWRRGKTIMSLEEIDDITLYRAFDIEE